MVLGYIFAVDIPVFLEKFNLYLIIPFFWNNVNILALKTEKNAKIF